MATLRKTKQETKEQMIELSNQIIAQLQEVKEKVRNMSPENKKRTLAALAGFGALLAGIGAYKKYRGHKTGIY